MKSSLNICREYGEEAGLAELGFVFSSQGVNEYVFFIEHDDDNEMIVMWLNLDGDGKPCMKAIHNSREWFAFGSKGNLKMEVLEYLSGRKFTPAIKILREMRIKALLSE